MAGAYPWASTMRKFRSGMQRQGSQWESHYKVIMCVAFWPGGRHILSGSNDKTICIWDAEMGKPVAKPFRGHTDLVMSVAFSPDCRCVLSGSNDERIQIWDAETEKPVADIDKHTWNWEKVVCEAIEIWKLWLPPKPPFQGFTQIKIFLW